MVAEKILEKSARGRAEKCEGARTKVRGVHQKVRGDAPPPLWRKPQAHKMTIKRVCLRACSDKRYRGGG